VERIILQTHLQTNRGRRVGYNQKTIWAKLWIYNIFKLQKYCHNLGVCKMSKEKNQYKASNVNLMSHQKVRCLMPRELYDESIYDDDFESETEKREFDVDNFFVDESEFPQLFENQKMLRAADL